MTSRKHHCLTKNTRSEAKYSEVALSSNSFSLYVFLSPCVSLSVSLCICLLSLPFRRSHWHCFPDCSIIQDIKSDPLQCEDKGERETHAFSFEYTPATTSQNSDKKKTKKNKKKKTQKHKHSDAQTDGDMAQTWTHTRTRACRYLPDTHHILTDKHTKKQQTQSTAQPEVYFMQKYSKVCFTIQLNIKGWYIPLWSLTPQWTNPTHPHPLTAYRESCWTSPLITR